MTEEKYTAEQLEQMADQLLQEAAPAQDKPAKGGLDEKTIASLPAAALLNASASTTRSTLSASTTSAASSSRTIWTSRRWRPSPRSRRRSWSTPTRWWTASTLTIPCVCT